MPKEEKADDLPDRSGTPFFADLDTKKTVEELAQLSHLVIYAGAGATVDQTGVDWAGLIRQIRGADRDVVDYLLRHQGERRTASMITQHLINQSPDQWQDNLYSDLRRVLYANVSRVTQWAGGRLTTNIARLAALWASDPQRSICLATTNYEDFLELAAEEQAEASDIKLRLLPNEVENKEVESENEELSVVPDAINLLYLHGYLARARYEGASPSEHHEHLGVPVFCEDQYADVLERTSRWLTSLFKDNSVLIVGSGLNDDPLISALAKSKREAQVKGLSRFVVFPRGSWAHSEMGPARLDDIQKHIAYRLEHLGLRGIFPDFYGQVGQLLQEVELSAVSGPGAYYMHPEQSSHLDYNKRLAEWWEGWKKTNCSSRELRDRRQTLHYKVLEETLKEIRKILDTSDNEALKLEVWLRWEPSRTNRRLRLWVSSSGILRDLDSHREGEITTLSDYVSARVFCDGRPRRFPDDQKEDPPVPNSRWMSYLATPIWLGKERYSQVPVGVVTLASKWPAARGCLKDDNRRRHQAALLALQKVGVRIANPIPPRRSDAGR